MNQSISILCTGSELLDGRIVDTNSQFVIRQLKNLGLDVGHVLSCRDGIENIVSSLNFLVSKSAVIIVSGGLGPTSDDVTRDAVAQLLGEPLVRDEESLQHLKGLYDKRRRRFEESNARQADFPRGARVLKNPIGTAPGFLATAGSATIICVPGVPREMEIMLEESISPFLKEKFAAHVVMPKVRVLRVFGLAEARIGELVEHAGVPSGISISYRASFPEICVRLSGANSSAVELFTKQAREAIGEEFIFGTEEGPSFQSILGNDLIQAGLTIAGAESCTGGLVSELLTATPGSSKYFLGAVVSYSNSAKRELLGVNSETLSSYGAVSHETARAMAAGALSRFNSDCAFSITGIAGPEGGTESKPVGTFFVGFATRTSLTSHHCFLNAPRDMHRQYSAHTALDVVRRHLHKLPPIHARTLATTP